MAHYKFDDDESQCLIFLPGKASHCVVDDIIFGDLGWAWASMAGGNGSEYIFAYGWHKSGVAIEALRKVSGNLLCGWSEAQITFYEQWYPPWMKWTDYSAGKLTQRAQLRPMTTRYTYAHSRSLFSDTKDGMQTAT